MATFTAATAFNAENVYDFTATSHSGSSTVHTFFGANGDKYVVSGSGITVGMEGSDFYANLAEGTLTTIAMYKAGVLQWTLKDFPWNDNVDVWSQGYDLGSNIGTLYGMEAEIAYNLRYNDTINGSSGNDKLRGYNGNDTVKGNGGDDHVAGNAGNDKLYGGDGNDTVKGGGGTNIVDGGAGVDTSSYDWMTVGAKVNLALTTAQLIATSGPTDTLTGIENLTGSAYADVLTGNAVANKLVGAGGNDALNGGAGNDTLVGGIGIDTLTGGVGMDGFVFESALNAGTNVDTIKDFVAADDTIKLENAIFKKLATTGVLNAANFKANLTGNATDSNDFVLYETDTGKLFYDLDGNGAGAKVLFAVLGTATHPAITAADFVVI